MSCSKYLSVVSSIVEADGTKREAHRVLGFFQMEQQRQILDTAMTFTPNVGACVIALPTPIPPNHLGHSYCRQRGALCGLR